MEGKFCTVPYRSGNQILMSFAIELKDYVGSDSGVFPKIGTAIGAGVSLNGLLCLIKSFKHRLWIHNYLMFSNIILRVKNI